MTEDEIVAKLSDYLEGKLADDERAEVESKIASDAEWKRVLGELEELHVEQHKMISGLRKAKAPETFTRDVTSTIRKRSAGRFFTFGYRVPFGAVLAIALVALAAIAWLMRSSDGGSSKRVDEPDRGTEIAPRP